MSADGLNISKILTEARWYGNSGVTWQGAPDGAHAEHLAVVRIKRLRRKPQNRPKPDFDQLAVADALSGCEDGRRCLNGACPECARALQRWLVSQVVRLAHTEGSNIGMVTVVPAGQIYGSINGQLLADMMASLCAKITATGAVKWAALCLDLSYNDFRQVSHQWPEHHLTVGWQPHIHGFVEATEVSYFKAAMRDAFPPDTGVPMPVKTMLYDGSPYGASYALKPVCYRRVSYFDSETGALKAEDYDLTAEQDVLALRAMSELGLAGRIQLIGLNTLEDETTNKLSLTVADATVS